MKPSKLASAASLTMALLVTACGPSTSEGPVATAEEAIARARASWKQIHEKASWHATYAEENTARFEPCTATLENGIWMVRATVPSGYRGEVLETRVRQVDGGVSVSVVEVR